VVGAIAPRAALPQPGAPTGRLTAWIEFVGAAPSRRLRLWHWGSIAPRAALPQPGAPTGRLTAWIEFVGAAPSRRLGLWH
jgi:hypothetical protein